MKQFLAVLKKELKGYIDHPTAYILAVVFLVLNNFLYFRTSLVQEVASLRSMFTLIPWIFIFFISALTMRTWAEERKEKTLHVLLSYPAKVWQLILGKFFATSIFISFVLLLTLLVPLGMGLAGNFDWGVVFAQYLGSIFLILALVGIGQWASSLTKNQVVAFIISIAVQFTFVIIGLELVVIGLPYPLNQVAQQLGILAHFSSITRGVLDVRDILYFLSLAFVFMALSYAWLIRIKSVKGSATWRKLQTSVIVLIAIAVVINLFGQSFTLRADLTEQNLYSLSAATKSLLRNLDDTVRITIYRSKKLPTQIELVNRDVLDIVNDYSKFGGRNVDVQIKFPDVDEEAASAAQAAGIPAVEFNVRRQDEFTVQKGYHGLTIEYLDKKEVLPFVSSIGDLEYNLTRNIVAMQSEKKDRIGFVSDFGGKTLQELASISEALNEQYTVEQINLTATEEGQEIVGIGEGIEALVISTPTQNFSAAALAEIDKYIQSGGKILWMLSGVSVDQQALSASANNTGLDAFLNKEGVTIEKDIVADLVSHQNVTFSSGIISYILPYPYWVVAQSQPHLLVGNANSILTPWPSSISYEESKENIKPILKTSDSAVHFSNSFSLNPNTLPDFSALDQSIFTLGVTVENVGAAQDNPAGRWVVFTSSFLDEGTVRQSPQNGAIFLNSLDWLLQNEALLTIRSKNSQASGLIWKSSSQQNLVNWGNTGGVPLLVVMFGVIWIWRRRRLKNRIV